MMRAPSTQFFWPIFIYFIFYAEQFEGTVTAVLDGDTIEVLHNGKPIRVRLNGIDCPEQKQAFGTKAKQFTAYLVFKKSVKVFVRDIDRYGRSICDIYMHDGTWVNKRIVEEGLAWHYKKYSNDIDLAKAEANARKLQRGLWNDSQPIEPWKFRVQQRNPD